MKSAWRCVVGMVAVMFFFSGSAFGASGRFSFMGSSNLVFPTGFVQSRTEYISDGSHNAVLYSQKIPGNIFEVSLLRHMNGSAKDKNIFNVKVKVLEEGGFVPSVVWGVGDFQRQLGSKIFFVAGSKNFETYGVTIHGGVLKDPVTTQKKEFWGVEKMILPLVYVVGETFDRETSVGIKLRPYPGLNVEYAQQDIGKDSKQDLFKLVYHIPF
jgi:hypothetical protein